MLNLSLLLSHSLIYGLILSTFMTIAFVALAWINPDIWLKDYPPAVQAKLGPISAKAQRQRTLLGIPVFLCLFGILFAAIWQLGTPTFLEATLCIFIVMLIFNVMDLIVLDWLIFLTWRPHRLLIAGVEQIQGALDYAFHFKAFLKGLVGITLASPIIAGIVLAVQFLWR
jgi:hypothetical protein